MKTEILEKVWNKEYTNKASLIQITIEIQHAPKVFYIARSTYIDAEGNTSRNDYDFESEEAARTLFNALKDLE
jgi:hypothetical protein